MLKFYFWKKNVFPTLTLFILRVFFGQFLCKNLVFTVIFKTCWKFTQEKKGVIPASSLFVFNTVFDFFRSFLARVLVSKFTLMSFVGYVVWLNRTNVYPNWGFLIFWVVPLWYSNLASIVFPTLLLLEGFLGNTQKLNWRCVSYHLLAQWYYSSLPCVEIWNNMKLIHRDYPDYTLLQNGCIIHNLLYIDHQFCGIKNNETSIKCTH